MINKTTESDPHPRRHPLFPTAREITQRPELAFSDHLPNHALLKQANLRNARQKIITDLDRELKSLTGFSFLHLLSKPSPEKIKLLQSLRQQVMDVPLGSSAEVFLKILTNHNECSYSKIRKPT